jgi:excisionase family DNA binding protein
MESLLTIKQTAAILAISPEFVKKLQRRGKVRVIRIGRAVRVSPREVERLCRDGLEE